MLKLFNLFKRSNFLRKTTIANSTFHHQPFIFAKYKLFHNSSKVLLPTNLEAEQIKIIADKIPPTSESFTQIAKAIDEAEKDLLEGNVIPSDDPNSPGACFKRAVEKANRASLISPYFG